jgi:hypothetical protein
MKCQRQGLRVSGEKVLKGFTYLAAIYTRFVDGSVQLRVEELDPFQRDVVEQLGEAAVYPGLVAFYNISR